jgi:hypothetical protein
MAWLSAFFPVVPLLLLLYCCCCCCWAAAAAAAVAQGAEGQIALRLVKDLAAAGEKVVAGGLRGRGCCCSVNSSTIKRWWYVG